MLLIAHLFLKIFLGALGTLAIYVGCFLYEDEEGKLQNAVEKLSQALKARRDAGESLPLVSTISGAINHILDRILGNHLLSWRMAGISICFSLLSFWSLTAGVYLNISMTRKDGVYLITNALFCFVLGALSTKYPSRWTIMLSFLPLAFVFYGVPYVGTAIPLSISLASDVILIFAIRTSLRSLLKRPTVLRFITTLSMQVVIIGALVGIPAYLALSGFNSWNPVTDEYILGFQLCGMNIPTAVVAVIFVLVLLFFLLHKLFWPVASRIIYPLARFKVLLNRKFMVGSGVACFAVISPPFAGFLEKLEGWFH